MQLKDACPRCGGKNDVHTAECPLGDTALAAIAPAEPDKSAAALMGVACQRLDDALKAVPIDIALGALAIIVGRAQYSLQRDPVKRSRNLKVFGDSVNKAINMVVLQEKADEDALLAAQQADPIRKLN